MTFEKNTETAGFPFILQQFILHHFLVGGVTEWPNVPVLKTVYVALRNTLRIGASSWKYKGTGKVELPLLSPTFL